MQHSTTSVVQQTAFLCLYKWKSDEKGWNWQAKNLGGYSKKAGCFSGGSMKMKSQKATKSYEANVVN